MRSASSFSAPELAEVAGRLVGESVSALELLQGGRNSRVVLATLADGRRVVVKQYHRHPNDLRDRFGVEVNALRFLRANGVDEVPVVLNADAGAAVAVFEHVEGSTFPPERPGTADVEATLRFVGRLAGLRTAPGAPELPAASEATFSSAAARASVERRLERLREPAARDPRLAEFLDRELARVLARLEVDANDQAELPSRLRTLSPSDFGFHNAVRKPDGALVFVDFEYFGWDDPAKLVCDFVLHPGMELTEELRSQFVMGALGVFADDTLPARIEALYPLYAVKWALILLNEFLPDELDRRRFAGRHDPEQEILGRQLEKARRLIQQVDNHHAGFRHGR